LENSYLKNSIDAFQAAVTRDFNAGMTTSQAIENNKSRLVYGTSYAWGGPWNWYRPWFSPYYGYASYPVAKERYRYAHLIVEAVDRKTNKVVWQARGSGEVNSPEKATTNIAKVVKGIFKQYPTSSKK